MILFPGCSAGTGAFYSAALVESAPVLTRKCRNAQNPLDTFPYSFPIDVEVANLLPTCYETGVMDFGLYCMT